MRLSSPSCICTLTRKPQPPEADSVGWQSAADKLHLPASCHKIMLIILCSWLIIVSGPVTSQNARRTRLGVASNLFLAGRSTTARTWGRAATLSQSRTPSLRTREARGLASQIPPGTLLQPMGRAA